MNLKNLVYISILLLLEIGLIEAFLIRFTNIKCEEFEKSFADFKNCNIKMVGRNKVALNIHMRLFQIPVTNITINAALYRKSHDYRPFMYNTTLNGCEFFKNPSRYLFWKTVYDMARPFSNVNHSCPYDHDLIVRDIILTEDMYNNLPLPAGEYKFKANIAAYNSNKVAVSIFMTIVT